MAVGRYKIPFSVDGKQLLHYAGWIGGQVEWRDNEPFEARISFTSMTSGYSAKYLTVRDENGVSYPMFVKDALGVLQSGEVSGGVCSGRWCGQKRGQNYGIRLVRPDE